MSNVKGVVGTWFPTSFHGHFKSKSRLDFINEYRHIAKPTPPPVFSKRAVNNPREHTFSNHDNRHSFMDDALYFEQGMGRRRFTNKGNTFKNDFLAWAAMKNFGESHVKSSVYRNNFRHNDENSLPDQQILTRRPKTSFDGEKSRLTTSYRTFHSNDKVNQDIKENKHVQIAQVPPVRAIRAKSAVMNRDTVASCLNWHTEKPVTEFKPLLSKRYTSLENYERAKYSQRLETNHLPEFSRRQLENSKVNTPAETQFQNYFAPNRYVPAKSHVAPIPISLKMGASNKSQYDEVTKIATLNGSNDTNEKGNQTIEYEKTNDH